MIHGKVVFFLDHHSAERRSSEAEINSCPYTEEGAK
jgi:hypothetical protein